MKNNTVEVHIYFPSRENSKSISDIVNIVNRQTGVVKAKINQHMKQLLDVEYSPDHVSSQVILNAVRRRGNTASLIGM